VVSDILMPVMDGLKMATAIRELDPDVPIVVTTAFERTDYLLQSIDVGIDKYVVKPVNMEKLAEAVIACAHRLRAEASVRLERERLTELRHHEAFGLLAAGMAHDYNNLLQGVNGYVDLAKMFAEPDCKALEYIERAKTILAKGRELGQNLQILAKGGMVLFRKVPVGANLVRAVTEAFQKNVSSFGLKRLVSAVMEGATVAPEFDISPDLPAIENDEKLLFLAFTHLTVNALESMSPSGRLKVSAHLKQVSEQPSFPVPPGEYLLITFCDQGCGIPEENLQKIFQPYFSTKERGAVKGMGLGLALCQSIVEKHGGHIRVESKPGAGSTFSLYFPLTREIPKTVDPVPV